MRRRALPALGFIVCGFLYAIPACSGGASSGPSGPDGGKGAAKTNLPSSPSNVSRSAEQQNGTCPSSPSSLKGTGATGASCSTYADCRPACCSCDASTRSFLGAACIDGKCADKGDACYVSDKGTLCPGDPIADAAPPRDASSPPPTGSTICTDGYGSDCTGVGEHWTGTQCCVENAATCVAGYSSDCTGPGESWTGSKCCIVGRNVICAPGYSSDCTGTSEHWTGSTCCVENVTQCVDGYSSDCTGTGEHWTGSKCCL